MMRLYVKEVAQNQGYQTAQQLADAMSAHFEVSISYNTMYAMWNDRAQQWSKIMLDRLCSFLKVPAGLLIQHIPGEWKEGAVESNRPTRKKGR
jgi:DNA-binding Xre family transcriptional regulator